MIILAALAIFFASLLGLLVFARRKIPALVALHIGEKEGIGIRQKLRERLENIPLLRSPELFLQTLLSKLRIFALRLETKTAEWLMRLRKKSQEQQKFSEHYWDKVKNDNKPA